MKKADYSRFILSILGLVFLHTCLNAQPGFPVPAPADEEGFVEIFDGKTLDGWDGDPTYWSVVDGVITGSITPETLLERNTFLIWRDGAPGDFELKLEYRVSAEGNSGINYRSLEVDTLPWALKGYQLDIDGKGRWTGQNYEERGRRFLALRGEVNRIMEDKKPEIIGSPGSGEELLAEIHQAEWNEVRLIARGNILTHIINGRVMCMVVDDDEKNRSMEGWIGVQVHVGPPMKIEYRNIRIKQY